MTSLVATESVTVDDDISVIDSEINCCKNRQRRHILRSKENTYKHRCNQVLKRKLKKYKLRHDGREDQDVLDVSKILVSALRIKSPNKSNQPVSCEGDISEFEDLRPRNYLINMVKRKESVKISASLKNANTDVKNHDKTIDIPLATNSQEKKQTNAFKLLMDSRNKSLGSNSPGKDKSNDNSDSEEIVERKNNKAKRKLLLQKMAEAKGSLKNKEKEDYKDNMIKKQLEKRAERLKSMISKDAKPVKENESTSPLVSNKDNNPKSLPKAKVEVVNNDKSKKQMQTLTIVDIFNTIEDPTNISSSISPVKRFIPKEDQEFLNKLSPSLKKRESMLSYFKKVDKDTECSTNSESDNLIKVKLKSRNKKRGKKKKLSLKINSLDSCDLKEINQGDTNEVASNTIEENNQVIMKESKQTKVEEGIVIHLPEPRLMDTVPLSDNVEVEDSEVKSGRQKRKRKTKVDAKVIDSLNTNATVNNENRPKRSVKRPVKYSDDACLSSSDEELHIFTPKKKKHIDVAVKDEIPVLLKPNHSIDELVKNKSEKKDGKVLRHTVTSNKPAKLAPIFVPKQSDPAALVAKQKFLQSGVPEKLKKIIQQQKNCFNTDNGFPVVVHVQQNNTISVENKMAVNIPMMNSSAEETCLLTYEKNAFQKLLYLNQEKTVSNINSKQKKSTQTILQNMKQLHPKFPVYRTYRLLKGKGKGEFRDCNYVDVDNSIEIMSDMVDVINDSPDRLNWTDKYKATSTNEIIGNFATIKELRKWLVSWTENELKSKTKSKPGSDSSDYYQSESDSRDSIKTMNNLLILTGPTGCGKTASVYAVASDLAMKVIEVNASSRRTGKIMLQDLQEATQSHKVNRGTGNSDNSQKSQEKPQSDLSKKNKKRGRPKRSIDDEKPKKQLSKTEVLSSGTLSQEGSRTDSSLILIDDADIVFDQDDGFSSAILQLVQCSKRPVILITSSLVCPHLQRFLQNGKLLKMCPLLPRMLGTWLDIMCLADSGICWPGVGAKFLNYFKGDIRKTINYLQFCIPSYVHGFTSEDETTSQNIDFYKSNVDEESSCPSWAENEDSEGITLVNNNVDLDTNTIWTDFVDKHLNLFKFTYPLQLYNIWWSMPGLLTVVNNTDETLGRVNHTTHLKKNKVSLELEAIANAADAFSLSDYFSHINPDANTYITSQPWHYPEQHSVSEKENSDYYHKEYEVTSEICQTMVTSSIETAQNVLRCNVKTDINFPGMNLYR